MTTPIVINQSINGDMTEINGLLLSNWKAL